MPQKALLCGTVPSRSHTATRSRPPRHRTPSRIGSSRDWFARRVRSTPPSSLGPAMGLSQLMGYGKGVRPQDGYRKDQPKMLGDPALNLRIGTGTARLFDRWDGRAALAIGSYNAGPGAEARWVRARGSMPPRLRRDDPVPQTCLYTSMSMLPIRPTTPSTGRTSGLSSRPGRASEDLHRRRRPRAALTPGPSFKDHWAGLLHKNQLDEMGCLPQRLAVFSVVMASTDPKRLSPQSRCSTPSITASTRA